MIALGADLIADDQVDLTRSADHVRLSAPAPTQGLIEARGLGLLRCPSVQGVHLHSVLDLDLPEPDRLPPIRTLSVLGVQFPLIAAPKTGHAASALLLYLKHGRQA